MDHKRTQKRRLIHWIDPSNLHKLKVKSRGYTGGCKSAAYVITEDGELFLIKKE